VTITIQRASRADDARAQRFVLMMISLGQCNKLSLKRAKHYTADTSARPGAKITTAIVKIAAELDEQP